MVYAGPRGAKIRRLWAGLLQAACAAVWCAGCARAPAPEIGRHGYHPQPEEHRMRLRADALCARLDTGGYLYADRKLENYLTGIADSVFPLPAREAGVRVEVKILHDPSLNAFAFPNGRIYVHTGMLALVENEAQAAALLAHEISHIINRDALRAFRSMPGKSAFLAAIRTPPAQIGGRLGTLLAELAVVSSAYGYPRGMEEDADRDGYAMLQTAGYDPRESVKFFARLKEFIDDEEIKQQFFFSSHANVAARIKNYGRLLDSPVEKPATPTPQTAAGDETCRRMVRGLILDTAAVCLNTGMFKTAAKLLARYRSFYPDDPRGYFYAAELWRLRRDYESGIHTRDKQKDYARAVALYDSSLALNPGYAEALKQKACVLQMQGKSPEAKAVFIYYLTMNPLDPERGYIEKFLAS